MDDNTFREIAISCVTGTPTVTLTGAVIILIIAYLIGSLPFGLILAKAFGYGDIRKIGSGNIGATNVLRTGNKKLAFATLLLDFLKGFIIFVLIQPYMEVTTGSCPQYADADWIANYNEAIYEHFLLAFTAGLAAIIGHCYPVWLKFKGGKGVATTLGVLLAAVPFTGLIACVTWLISAKFGKISSLAAMSAMIVAPVMTYVFYGIYPALINALISALVIWRHRSNIARIRAGTEPRIGDKKKDA